MACVTNRGCNGRYELLTTRDREQHDINSTLLTLLMTFIAYLRAQADELGRLMGDEPTDWEGIYHTSSDEELEEMARIEAEIQSRCSLL